MIGSLLVYGTLRPNRGETITLSGYKMYDLGWYPGVVKTGNPDDKVVCERVEVKDESHLATLDAYEGCNGNTPGCLYHRVNLYEDQMELDPTWIYLYNKFIDKDFEPEVESGDWLGYRGESSGTNAKLMEV